MKTNAIRLLELAKVPFELIHYEVDESDLSGETVAAKIGFPQEQVFKTLITQGDATGHLFALIPVGENLNLKALAKASGNRKIELVPLKEVLAVTGYVRGGVTPIAAKREFPVFIDETIVLWEKISLSAGSRGIQMILHPEDLIRLTKATLCDLTAKPA